MLQTIFFLISMLPFILVVVLVAAIIFFLRGVLDALLIMFVNKFQDISKPEYPFKKCVLSILKADIFSNLIAIIITFFSRMAIMWHYINSMSETQNLASQLSKIKYFDGMNRLNNFLSYAWITFAYDFIPQMHIDSDINIDQLNWIYLNSPFGMDILSRTIIKTTLTAIIFYSLAEKIFLKTKLGTWEIIKTNLVLTIFIAPPYFSQIIRLIFFHLYR